MSGLRGQLLPLCQLQDALQQHPLVLLEAPPGTGKTTQVPPACLDLWPGQIWVLEPRRLAAKYAARWVSSQLGQALGQQVGYQVRLDSCCGPNTRLVYMTQGVFARRIAQRPDLDGVDLVILDEFHERSIDNDLALAWLRRHSRCRVLIMSATLPANLAERLGHPPHLVATSPLYPIALGYEASQQAVEQKLASVLPESRGSGLVFLPGMAEIRRSAQHLQPLARRCGAQIQILHGSLEPQEQDRVLQATPDSKRWVLTTNVAETSLTVPGVSWVVDSGLARVPVQPPHSTLSRLETVRISQFSAVQRCGRAGRLGPGQCLRLYSEAEFLARPASDPPELLRSDLSSLVLLWLHLGQPQLDWLDEPPPAAWEAALRLLRRLGAIGEKNGLTELGKSMAGLPVEPRLGRFLLGYPRDSGRRAVAWLARGGDRQQPDLEEYLQTSQRLPEERQLRCEETFASQDIDQAMLAAYPDRVAQVRRGSDLVLCDGSGFRLAQPMPENPWLLALDIEIDSQRKARLSAFFRIDPELLLDSRELQEVCEYSWNADQERVEECSQLRYQELVLEQTRRTARPCPQSAALLLRHALDSPRWKEQLDSWDRWQGRLHWARTTEPSLPSLPDPHQWLERVCQHISSLGELQKRSWKEDVSPALVSTLNRLCPESVALSPRRRAEIHYSVHQAPWLASKLVDFFGQASGPQLAQGRIPLVLHLLAPNFRPLQVTQDLAGFWQRHYAKVRQELCRRYPRHPWPEDPLNPQAEELRPKKRT